MRCAVSFSRKTACSTIFLSSLPRAYSERLRLSGERGEYGSPHSAEFLAGSSEDEEGYIDHSLIPTDIQAWYVDSSDEEDTVSKRESDLETEEPSDVSDHDSEAKTN